MALVEIVIVTFSGLVLLFVGFLIGYSLGRWVSRVERTMEDSEPPESLQRKDHPAGMWR